MNHVFDASVTGFNYLFKSRANIVLEFERESARHFKQATVACYSKTDATLRHSVTTFDIVRRRFQSTQSFDLKEFYACRATIRTSLPHVLDMAGERCLSFNGNRLTRFVRKNVLTNFCSRS